MGRSILAVVLGAILAVIAIATVESVSHIVYPPPPGLSPNDMEAVREYMAKIPTGALLMVALAWLVGATVGGWFAAWFARRSPAVCAWIVCGLVLLAGLANLLILPHPTWFWPVGLAAFPLGTLVGLRLAGRA
ncbi:MAG: hypothetical protein U0746_21760 [Gemmataceae bacterium]